MRKAVFCLAGAAFAVTAVAEMKNNPDPNTLWCEDGKAIVTQAGNSRNGWNNALKYESMPDGKGFSVEFEGKPTGGRYVEVSAEYPWFIYEISDVELKKGYCQNAIGFQRVARHAQIGKIFPGVYAFNLYENSALEKKGRPFMRIDQFRSKLTYRYMKMVKVPENYIQCESDAFKSKKAFGAGDKLKFTVTLKDPAEDVALSFFKSYTMPQVKLGDGTSLQLKQADKDGRVWTGELTVAPQDGKFKPNDIWVKADVTGGGIALPLWTAIPYDYK